MFKRRKLRNRTKKNHMTKGLSPLKHYLEKLDLNGKVAVTPLPDVHEYFPPKTMHGHIGTIKQCFKSNVYKVYIPSLKKFYIGIKAHLTKL